MLFGYHDLFRSSVQAITVGPQCATGLATCEGLVVVCQLMVSQFSHSAHLRVSPCIWQQVAHCDVHLPRQMPCTYLQVAAAQLDPEQAIDLHAATVAEAAAEAAPTLRKLDATSGCHACMPV